MVIDFNVSRNKFLLNLIHVSRQKKYRAKLINVNQTTISKFLTCQNKNVVKLITSSSHHLQQLCKY